jgi:hypothetical protein
MPKLHSVTPEVDTVCCRSRLPQNGRRVGGGNAQKNMKMPQFLNFGHINYRTKLW